MGLNLKPLLEAIADTGSASIEKRGRKLILLAGVVALVLILVWKRG